MEEQLPLGGKTGYRWVLHLISFVCFALFIFVVWCSGLCFCGVFIWLSFCLIRTCNQIAIWYSQVVQLSVRETQSLTWLAHPQGETVRQSGRVFYSQGIQTLCTLEKKTLSPIETGLTCRMKHLMQFNSYYTQSLFLLFFHVSDP